MPEDLVANVKGWARLMPDFRIQRWDESNFDVGAHPWTARMHAAGRYAFASDFARLQVLHEHGGVYLDADMVLKKCFAPLLDGQCIWSFEFDSFLASCFIAAVPGHALIGKLLAMYDALEAPVVNNALVTEYFLGNFPEFRLNNKDQRIGGGIRVLPKEYLVIPSFDSRKNYAVHMAKNQWKEKGGGVRPGMVLRAVLGDVFFYKLLNIWMNAQSTYPAMDRARRRG